MFGPPDWLSDEKDRVNFVVRVKGDLLAPSGGVQQLALTF